MEGTTLRPLAHRARSPTYSPALLPSSLSDSGPSDVFVVALRGAGGLGPGTVCATDAVEIRSPKTRGGGERKANGRSVHLISSTETGPDPPLGSSSASVAST